MRLSPLSHDLEILATALATHDPAEELSAETLARLGRLAHAMARRAAEMERQLDLQVAEDLAAPVPRLSDLRELCWAVPGTNIVFLPLVGGRS